MTTMEDLTKTQIVLLTILISFVTSIATGIITTSLLAQAPASVIQTINRVVEHTIEKVAPAPDGSSSTKEVTVINEDDAVTSAISNATPAVVRIQTPAAADGTKSFYGLGVIVSKSGLVLSDKFNIISNAVYSVTLSDGTTLPATVVHISDKDNIATFQIQPDATHNNNFSSVDIAQGDLKLGQTVIGIEGKTKNYVEINRATSFETRTSTDSSGKTITTTYAVDTDIPETVETLGAPLLNLSGELVGIKSISNDGTLVPGAYITSSSISDLLNTK